MSGRIQEIGFGVVLLGQRKFVAYVDLNSFDEENEEGTSVRWHWIKLRSNDSQLNNK